jgi:hypothetical protein
MQLNILNLDRFVSVNNLPVVTDPIFFESGGIPTTAGVFSHEIFGRSGSVDRQTQWAYIDLKQPFLHPLIYKTCTQLDRKFSAIIAATRKVKLTDKGEIVDAEEGEKGWTGLDSLYDNWNHIDWGIATEGGQRAERVGLLRMTPKELAFMTKWHVMPASYRDVDTNTGNIREVPPINYLYSQLIAGAPPLPAGMAFADGSRRLRAQENLLEIHKSCLDIIAGKRGLVQDVNLGKYADYGVRGILSAPTIGIAETPEEMPIPFGYCGVPLYLVINLFQPFIIKSLSERLRVYASAQENVMQTDMEGNTKLVPIPKAVPAQLGAELYKKWIARYIRSQENRLDPPAVKLPNGELFVFPLYDNVLKRRTTLTDLFYIAASVVLSDKHIMFTRYPVEDFRAPHMAKVFIQTTEKTEKRIIGSTTYNNYPVLDNPRWVDSIRLHNSYTKAMGADYDGDAMRLFGLFTQEANAEAERLIKAPTNFCDAQGLMGRTSENEAGIALYSLTR